MKLQRENLKGKNVLVFGSGISGMGAVKLLAEVEARSCCMMAMRN